MNKKSFISIDQNSHPLWDPAPKLAALAQHGYSGIHALEDIDAAFTRHGAALNDTTTELKEERYYRGGVTDWGAALFYMKICGRLPMDIRLLEPYTSMKTAALSRKLDCSVDELYDRWSGSDNFQLIGSSYFNGDSNKHRVIGDVKLAEVKHHVQELMNISRQDCLDFFADKGAQQRLTAWFDTEQDFLNKDDSATLIALYNSWMQRHIPENINLELTSDTFNLNKVANDSILNLFLNNYTTCCNLYNEAVHEQNQGITPIHTKHGGLPFFAVFRTPEGRMYRCSLQLEDDWLIADDKRWKLNKNGNSYSLPVVAMAADGVISISGKAIVLVLQVRSGANGVALALPEQGSLYMPTAFSFENKLRKAGLIPTEVAPVLRIHLDLFKTQPLYKGQVNIPDYLAGEFTALSMSCNQFIEELDDNVNKARETLKALKNNKKYQQQILSELSPVMAAEKAELELKRRELARNPETRHMAGDIWDKVKELDQQMLTGYVDFIIRKHQLLEQPYYNSRGATIPWSIGFGGMEAYQNIIRNSQITEESNHGI